MLKIYSNILSGPCRRVLYTAEALGLDYEVQEMDFRTGEMKAEDYLQKHPAGKVPAIEDEDVTLFESGAICKYLCDKQVSDLYPRDLASRALVTQWDDFCVLHVGQAMNKVGFNVLIAPKFGLPVDENSLKEGRVWLARYLPVVDLKIGAEGGFLVGGALSLADITLMSVMDIAGMVDVDVSLYPQLREWRAACEAMPFWQRFRFPGGLS